MDERKHGAASAGKPGSAGQDATATAQETPKASGEPTGKERAPSGAESEYGDTPPGLGPTDPETESNPSPS